MTNTHTTTPRLRWSNSGRDPQPIYSIEERASHQPNGRTRRLYALEAVEIFDTGTVLTTWRRVRKERRSGSWVFTNSGRFYTSSAYELRSVRYVTTVGG